MTGEAGLWGWAASAYAAPGVSDVCLELQDAAGQNVPLLLWAAWAARTGRAPDAGTLEAACDIARGSRGITPVSYRFKPPAHHMRAGPLATLAPWNP